MRKEFKKVLIGEICYLYPLPVIKENKYLIEVEINLADLIIEKILNGQIKSPDETPGYLIKKGYHQDGKTPLFRINKDLISFSKN